MISSPGECSIFLIPLHIELLSSDPIPVPKHGPHHHTPCLQTSFGQNPQAPSREATKWVL